MQFIRASRTFGSQKLSSDESGQAMVEYILIVAFSVALAAGLARTLTKSIDLAVLRIGSQLEKDLKTGRATLDVWKN